MRQSWATTSWRLPERWRVRRADLARLIRRGWPYALVAALGAALVVQLVRLMWAVLVPVGPVGDWQPPRAQILEYSQRKAMMTSFDPFFRGSMAGPEAVQVTGINMMLHGVTMNEATGGGSAILAGADGVQNSYAVGDEIMAGVTLAAVAFDHVVLDRGGVRETLFMRAAEAAETPAVISDAPLASSAVDAKE